MSRSGLGGSMQDVFARVVHQAEERRAADERRWAEARILAWQRALVLRLLLGRFGALPEWVAREVENASVETLNRYAERCVRAGTLEEVVAKD